MSHDQFISTVHSRLSAIISSDPLFSDIHCSRSQISFPPVNPSRQRPPILIFIRRFDNSVLSVHVSEDARVFQLKRAIKDAFSEQQIHWKTIWKKYALSTQDQQQLTNNNRRIKDYRVADNCELFFVRQRRLK